MAKQRKKTEEPAIVEPGEDMSADAAAEPVAAAEAEAAAVPPLEQELAEAKATAAKNWDLYLRERADLENFRKRSQRDKEEAIRFANDRLLKEMVPVLDNLERAVEHAGQAGEGLQGLIEGVTMTITQFRKVLNDFGVKAVVAVGEPFDPNLHQAMGQIETADHPPNTVVTEFQKGYLLNDRLLRPALVMVAKAPAESPAGDPPADA